MPVQPEHEVCDGVHLLRYIPRSTSSISPTRRVSHQKAATKVLRKHLPKVDIVHGHTPLSYLAALDFYGGQAKPRYTIHSPVELGNEDCLRQLGAHAQGDGTDCVAAPECDGERRIATIAGDYCSVKVHRRLA